MRRALVGINSGAILLASIQAGMTSDPAAAITRMVNLMIPPPMIVKPPVPGPNPKKALRGPWDKGFRRGRKR